MGDLLLRLLLLLSLAFILIRPEVTFLKQAARECCAFI